MIQLFDEIAVDFAESERRRMMDESELFWSNRPEGWDKREEEYQEEAKTG